VWDGWIASGGGAAIEWLEGSSLGSESQSGLPFSSSLWEAEAMSKTPFQSPLSSAQVSGPVGAPDFLQLRHWYETQSRVLPWRESPSFYRVWVSEIMLQQTQVVTVLPYFERFIQRFPTVEVLAHAPLEEVLLHWSGLGYYSRARNLHRGAQQVVFERKGLFPQTRAEWLEIPGVGPYTAGAILSIAGNQVEAILDGNVERVLSRLVQLGRAAGDSAYKAELWQLSQAWVQHAQAAGLPPSLSNQALMELGALVCTPRQPQCPRCPIQGACGASQAKTIQSFPEKKKRPEWLHVSEKVHCIFRITQDPLAQPDAFDLEGCRLSQVSSLEVLLRQRLPGEWRAGLWDFLEALPSDWEPLVQLGTTESQHVVTRHKIHRTTQVWRWPSAVLGPSGSRRGSDFPLPEGMRWVSVDPIAVPVGSALTRSLRKIVSEFSVFRASWPASEPECRAPQAE
jgi:A/G-specific adenine glycosylase